jgi:hypothetical protein
MSTYDFEPDPADYDPEPPHIANPSKRPWRPMTDAERLSFLAANPNPMTPKEWDALFATIEAKLKEKNT